MFAVLFVFLLVFLVLMFYCLNVLMVLYVILLYLCLYFVCSRLFNNGACNGDHMNFLLVDNKVYLDLEVYIYNIQK